MDNKQIAIIFIAIIMLTSLIGFSLSSGQNSGQDQPQDPGVQPKEEPVLSFEAKGLESSVDRILNSGIVFGCTSKIDLAELNKDLLLVKGIKSVASSEFINQKTLCLDLGYRASASFDGNTDFAVLIPEITGKTSLENVEVYRKAIVKIPQKVLLEGTGLAADLNLAKDFSFDQPFVEAFIDLTVLETDNVLVDLQLQLKGSQIVSVNALVTENLSAFSTHEISLATKLFALDEKLVFELKNAEYSGFDAVELAAKLKDVNEVLDANFKVMNLSKFSVLFDYEDLNADAVKDSIELELSSFEEIRALEFFRVTDTNKARILVDWNSSFSLLPLKEKIRAALLALGLKEAGIKIENPVATIQGQIELNTNETAGLTEKIKKALFPDLIPELRQTGTIAFSQLEDANAVFTVSEPVPAVVFTGHSMLDDIEFTVRFYAQRDKVLLAQAVEQGIQ